MDKSIKQQVKDLLERRDDIIKGDFHEKSLGEWAKEAIVKINKG